MILTVVFCCLYFFKYTTTPYKTSLKHGRRSKLLPRSPTVVINERIVHLDLKGAPPKMSYYPKLFALLRKLGATGILIEYEDMFPYNGTLLRNVPAYNAYSLRDIETINSLAKYNKLKVIPLIQTFGHLEFLLKLQEFKDYREVWNYPSSICPSYEKTLTLIQLMIEQIIDAHPYSDIIHIGSDEVFHIGKNVIVKIM